MQKYSDVVLSAAGTPVAGAVITVTTYPDGTAATIYGADGGPSVASVATNVNGRFSFYAANGHYSILVSGTGITPVTYNDVVLFDPKDNGSAIVKYGPRYVSDKLGERVSALDNGADGTGVTNCAALVNTLLSQNKHVRFTPGTYLFTADMVLNTNNFVTVEAGAKLIFNGARITSYLQSNITLEVHGEISSVGMTLAPAISGWPADVGGTGPTTTNERGFIEFGGISSGLQTGFRVFGTGKIHGDWTGTPSITNLWTGDLNYKGIAAFYSHNVDVSGVEVYGFRGESVYYYTSVAAKNIRFHDLYVHDTNFNALNFNVTAALSNSSIDSNVVDTAWQGVELSSGTARRNVVRNCVSFPVQLGGGTVLDVVLDDNDIYVGASVGLNGINAAGNPASITGNVIASRNRIYSATQSGIYAVALTSFKAHGNVIKGYATNVTASTNGYGISIDSNVAKALVRETVCSAPGAGANGCIRCLSPNASIKGTQTEDGSGNLLSLEQGPISSATVTQRDYRLITGVGASGIGFETIYGNGVPESLAATSPFAKTSAILTAVSGGEVGTYTIWTYKPTGSSTLAKSFIIDNYGQPQPDQDRAFDFGINGKRWANVWAVNVVLAPPASVTPANNGDMMFQLTSNTSLTIKVKGSDGVVRSASLTLA